MGSLKNTKDYARILERLTDALAAVPDSTLILAEAQPTNQATALPRSYSAIVIPDARCSPPAPMEMNRPGLRRSAQGSNNTGIDHG